jgi:hypothetical protein
MNFGRHSGDVTGAIVAMTNWPEFVERRDAEWSILKATGKKQFFSPFFEDKVEIRF